MEKKSMDNCLRRLKQELVSMKEAGDGLHDQMNCMMGALQELKLLQVQTALEQLRLSGDPCHTLAVSQHQRWLNGGESLSTGEESTMQMERTLDSAESFTSISPVKHSGSPNFTKCIASASTPEHKCESTCEILARNGSLNSCCSCTAAQYNLLEPEWSLNSSYSKQYREDSTYHTFSSNNSGYCDYENDDSRDWTCSLMSQSRNRQPLILGDNIFADLVENWLDLPEPEKKCDSYDQSAIRRSPDFHKKFSLTTNIFKKLLRSVRPDKDKLLKEKPGWLPTEDQSNEIYKRHKKLNKKKKKFYFPFQGNSHGVHNKSGKFKASEEKPDNTVVCTKIVYNSVEKAQPVFDMNTAVWV
ncbi:PAK4-inhibitor INKA2 [Protopterus annectens]|uniref:PAK4-inhibitor INKA2 n=1 Tax=Protopterus annectens TaxID=7888 RepID=UPI001CFB9CEB|nr:PAK4-inhibitor INKA2 [Protopterus annectens]